MSYCGNCLRSLDGMSSLQCPCRQGHGEQDRITLDKIITLHRMETDDDGDCFCRGCYNEWPCETRMALDEWGRG